MQMILSNTSSATSGCMKAIAPIVVSGEVVFDATVAGEEGSTALELAAVATGASAPFGGTIASNGCKKTLITVSYVDGDDCNDCTSPDPLTLVDVPFIMQPNSTYDIPSGFWTTITATLIDSDNAPVDLLGTQKQTVVLHSGYQPACADCVVLAP